MGQAKAPARNARASVQQPDPAPLMIPSNRTTPEGISIRWSSVALDPSIIIETQLLRLARLNRPAPRPRKPGRRPAAS